MRAISRRSFLAAVTSLAASRHVAKAAASDPTFLAIGDWGTGRGRQRKVAVQMARTAEAIGARFVVSTGDNFYPSGVKSLDDARWATSFEGPYGAPGLMIPWYVTLGNHDHKGSVSAQIAYTKRSSRWRLPARYYRHTELLANGDPADFLHIDTTPFGDIGDGEQLVWLERELAASVAPWKIVVGHHPVYAGSQRGGTEKLVARLNPLLQRYGVQVYLNGHEHHFEHIVVGKIHYLVCGGGAKPRAATGTEGTRFVAGDRLGFMAARLSDVAMDVEFIDAEGTSLYRTRIQRNPAVLSMGSNLTGPPQASLGGRVPRHARQTLPD